MKIKEFGLNNYIDSNRKFIFVLNNEKMKRLGQSLFCLIVLVLLSNNIFSQCSCVSACTITISGNNSSNIGNINPGTIVCVTATGNFTGTMGDITAGEICVSAGGVFAPTNVGNFNGGVINNEGTIDVSAKTDVNMVTDVNNCGTFIGHNISLNGGCSFNNYGELQVGNNFTVGGGSNLTLSGGVVTVTNDFINNGNITGDNCGIIDVGGTSTNTTNISGTIDICDASMPPNGFDIQNGTVGGDVTFCDCFPLPIELTTFDAVKLNDKVKITWATSSEINNDYFLVERSLNGTTWESIMSVDGAGNSSTTRNYEELDNNPYTDNTSYYRLKQVDFNGDYQYSDIESVYFEGIDIINTYPNPSFGDLKVIINSTVEIDANIKILNIVGKDIYDINKSLNKGFTAIDLSLEQLSSGIYYFTIRTSDGKYFSKKQIEIN